MIGRSLGVFLLGLAILGLSACAVQGPLYHWGPYETLVYQMYAEPGRADPSAQVEQLARDVAAAQASGERVAPGVHMHLGYMYWLQGDAGAARAEIETEKRIFPESSVFAERLLAAMRAP